MSMIRQGLALFGRSRDFAWLMASQFLAQAGDGIVQTALAKFIVFGGQRGFDIEGARSPDDLLRIALYVFVPYALLSPFLGVVIDRWDRRRLLIATNALRAVVLLLFGLFGIDVFGDAALFVAFLLTLAGTRVILATKAAVLPVALDGESLIEGNAVSQLGGAMFQLAGAGAAFIAAAVVPVEPVVVAGVLVYAAAAAAARRVTRSGQIHAAGRLREEVRRVVHNIAAGVREVRAAPQAAASISTYFWLRFLWSFSIVGIGFIARRLVRDDEFLVLALTGGGGALGAVLGFVWARPLLARVATTAHVVLGGSALAGGPVAVLGAVEAAPAVAALTFFLGLGFFLAKITLDTLVQQALGDDFRGRAFSLYDIAYNVAWVAAAALMKAWWSPAAQGRLIAVVGAVFLAGLVGLGAWYRRAGLLHVSAPVPA
ncbi:MAG TPA: MFS transporter [Actinomycetota bacterium]|nr:MFS transporter [Actinomycetota bacterium]